MATRLNPTILSPAVDTSFRLRDEAIVLDVANVGDRKQLRGTYVAPCW